MVKPSFLLSFNLYMIIKILIALIVFIGGYFVFFHIMKSNKVVENLDNKEKDFIPSNKFSGAKDGYVFKMDSHGLGYYLDK